MPPSSYLPRCFQPAPAMPRQRPVRRALAQARPGRHRRARRRGTWWRWATRRAVPTSALGAPGTSISTPERSLDNQGWRSTSKTTTRSSCRRTGGRRQRAPGADIDRRLGSARHCQRRHHRDQRRVQRHTLERLDDPCNAAPHYPVVQWAKLTPGCIDRVVAVYKHTLDQILTQIDLLRGCGEMPGHRRAHSGERRIRCFASSPSTTRPSATRSIPAGTRRGDRADDPGQRPDGSRAMRGDRIPRRHVRRTTTS